MNEEIERLLKKCYLAYSGSTGYGDCRPLFLAYWLKEADRLLAAAFKILDQPAGFGAKEKPYQEFSDMLQGALTAWEYFVGAALPREDPEDLWEQEYLDTLWDDKREDLWADQQ